MSWLVGVVMKMMSKAGIKVEAELNTMTQDPMKVQKELLLKMIEDNKDTAFGRDNHFDEIHSIEDYQRIVPIQEYDSLSVYIERTLKGETNVLTKEPIVHYNKTSGTMGVPKKIPLVESQVQIFSKYYAKYLYGLMSEKVGYDWCNGKSFTLGEGKCEVLPNGITYGSASALTAARLSSGFMKKMMGMMYSSPYEARVPEPGTGTRYLHALYALKNRDITNASCTFSSYFLEVLTYIENNKDSLIDNIEKGELAANAEMPDQTRASLSKDFHPDPARAAELRKAFADTDSPIPLIKRLWPRFTFLITVGGASFQTYTDKLIENYLGPDIPILYLGLSASEGMMSIPFEVNSSESVLTPETLFFEFRPVKDDSYDHLLTMDQLEVGEKYELIITNACGFYRYSMKDAVIVTGFHGKTPTIKFLYRINNTINLVGEKTTEAALTYTVDAAAKDLGVDLYDYSVYPYNDEHPYRYIFFIEPGRHTGPIDPDKLQQALYKNLCIANPDVPVDVKDGAYTQPEVKLLQNETFQLYRDVMVMRGTSPAQLKPPHVVHNEFQKKFFFKLVDEDVPQQTSVIS